MRSFKVYCGGKFHETVDHLINLGYKTCASCTDDDGPFIVAMEDGSFIWLSDYKAFKNVTDVIELPLSVVNAFKAQDIMFEIPAGSSVMPLLEKDGVPSIFSVSDGETFYIRTVDRDNRFDGNFLKLTLLPMGEMSNDATEASKVARNISGITAGELLAVLVEHSKYYKHIGSDVHDCLRAVHVTFEGL